MQLPDRLRLPFTFDSDLLARDLAGLSAVGWIKHFVPQNYDGDWSVVALRGPANAKHPIQTIYSDPSCTDFADTPMLAGSPNFRAVLAA